MVNIQKDTVYKIAEIGDGFVANDYYYDDDYDCYYYYYFTKKRLAIISPMLWIMSYWLLLLRWFSCELAIIIIGD